MSMIGKSLIHYEITSEIGRGGMGEVYQAKDTKLGRDVAIKVLPEEFALDTDRVARFQREAKLLASLNHPNIAAIHGLEESDGTHFLVMELIEGDTLRDRIKTGPIPVEEALKLALQMAEALEAAHEKGVIHRDLKPANIKVTPDGKVKILDFGLAKAYVGDQGGINLADSPTISAAATQKGVILGTAAYMSPEQARGKPVDKRTDIWAFGCVLFEMLTGQAAFQGEDVTEVLAAVVKSEVNVDLLPEKIHPRIREVLTRSLQKEQKKRYRDIGDSKYEIEQVLSDPSGIFTQPISAAESRMKSRQMLLWASITVLLLIIVGFAVWNLKTSEPHRVIRLNHELPEGQEFSRQGQPLVAVSGDGMNIVYVANNQLYLRNLNELNARPIQGTDEDPASPFFSPDGKSVGYYSFAESQLKKITVSGGASVTLCEATFPYGVTWGDDDTILFGQDAGIMRVSANGGPAEIIVEIEEGESVYGPQLLPNSEWVMFTFDEASRDSWDEAQIVVQSLESGERRGLVSGGSDAHYVSTGHLIYALGGVLYAIVFDTDNLEVIGGAVPVVEDVKRAYGQATGTANYGISDNGMLAYVVGSADTTPPRSLVWVDKEGNEEQIEAEPGMYQYPKISPDGTKVALTSNKSGNSDIWIYDLTYKILERLTFDDSGDAVPVWTSDGKQIIFYSTREKPGIYSKPADGTGEAEQIALSTSLMLAPYSFSPDGNTLVLQDILGPTQIDIGMLSMDDDHTYKLLLQEDYAEAHPQVSPDGKWIAYCSNETGQTEIFVRPFPEVNKGKWQISTDTGSSPLWSPDGRELFYLIGDVTTEAAMRVAVQTEPTFKKGTPEELFRGTYVGFLPSDFPWDIHPDGNRFLMIKKTGATVGQQPKINIVLNWFEELKQRVPMD